jgi:uncharacterized iron-regulated membrane protein
LISEKYIQSLRRFRALHRLIGITLALLLLISAITGILLALKKEVAIIQPPTAKGSNTELNKWKSFSEIDSLAKLALYSKYPAQKDNRIDRFDARPSKGIVKVLFKNGYWEVQIDPFTGEIKSIAKRHSDWIEALHDGSIVSDLFKLISMNFLGFGLLVLITTGLWLWYGPKKIRKKKTLLREKKLDDNFNS